MAGVKLGVEGTGTVRQRPLYIYSASDAGETPAVPGDNVIDAVRSPERELRESYVGTFSP